jgi:uncharacterized protein YukE
MTQANQDPEVFLTQVNDALEEVEDAIDAFLDASLNLINSAIAGASAHFHGVGGAIKGFFTGGPGGAVSGYIESFTNELVEQFTEGSNRIDLEWQDASNTIRQAIGSLMGDPIKMAAIASAYRDAIDELGGVRNQVDSANAYVEGSWQGHAHTAYANTSGFQLKALDAVVSALDDSAELLDDHAVQLVVYWTDQLQNLVNLAADIYDAIAEIGDVGNWGTAGAGVVVKLIANTASAATQIVTTAAAYWADLNIGKAGDWDGIQSKLGTRGLENDQWPDFTNLDRTQINGPWQTSA